LLKQWEGLGYYSRARNLQAGVKEVRDQYNSVVPDTRDEISTLRGIGPYTAGAILSIAYQKPEHAVDGNVMRVLSRVLLIKEDIAKPKTRKIFEEAVSELIDSEDPSAFNQGLMELGATICTPKSPKCLLCPVRENCAAFYSGEQNELPIKSKNKKVKSFFDFVRNNKDLMPFTNRQQILDNFNTIHERMKPQLEKLFSVKPKTQFEVKRTEVFREASSSAEYNQGSLDGTRTGVFYVPIPNPTTYNTYSDESLFLHEAIPGHHYQISLQQESTELPQFRKTLWYSGYGEGWALYTESLGKELGLYTDPYQYFGMLSQEMHRAIRLVVDTGMHSKGWTREQAIEYSLDNEADSEASITAEIERYMANPGQALSYKIGQLKIRELREKAKDELGEAFDIRQFHNQILETGCVPLALLENKINRWITANKKLKL